MTPPRAPRSQASLFDAPAARAAIQDPAAGETPLETAALAAAAASAASPKSKARNSAPDPEPGAESSPARGPRPAPPRTRETAQSLAARQREISISEFFTKNRHLLGFDNAQKALLTTVKEAVDNALDACEEAGILPDLAIAITEITEERFRVKVTDNGPGIVRAQIPRIFGQLLYGSKFHRLKAQRGQQGIGISAAGMYGQLTTGRPVSIVSKTGRRAPAHAFEIRIDTKRNQPEVLTDKVTEWDADHGTSVEIELLGAYKKGRRSVDDYVEQTALANPHAQIEYLSPKGERFVFERVTRELPKEALEIKPHPYGVELGTLMKMLKETKARNLRSFLQQDFSRVSGAIADAICSGAGVPSTRAPGGASPSEIERLHAAIPKVKIMAPPTNCLSPIGEQLIFKGLQSRVAADFVTSATRPPAVYRGMPFQVEVGLAYGGDLPAEELVEVYRFANRVPLQYQQAACAVTKAVLTTDWRSYGLSQSKGAPPTGPMIVFVHLDSVWVPFTSESKEAVAHYPEIIKELRLALQECGRRLGGFLRHRRRVADEMKKRSYIEKYLPHIGEALGEILALSTAQRGKAVENLKDILERSRKL